MEVFGDWKMSNQIIDFYWRHEPGHNELLLGTNFHLRTSADCFKNKQFILKGKHAPAFHFDLHMNLSFSWIMVL
jgi:hypothetical protein